MHHSTKKEEILLVADPSPAYRMLYAACHPGTVIEAAGPDEILEKAIAFTPDVIIMEANYPDMAPEELIWMLRLLRPEMRLVVCTDYPSEGFLEAGADECIPKTLLRSSIRETLFPVSPKEGV